jgi:hypothetical protein
LSKLRLCKNIDLPKIIPFPTRRAPIRAPEVLMETPEGEELAISQKRKRRFKFEYEAFRKISTKFVTKSYLRQTDLKTTMGIGTRGEEESLRRLKEMPPLRIKTIEDEGISENTDNKKLGEKRDVLAKLINKKRIEEDGNSIFEKNTENIVKKVDNGVEREEGHMRRNPFILNCLNP